MIAHVNVKPLGSIHFSSGVRCAAHRFVCLMEQASILRKYCRNAGASQVRTPEVSGIENIGSESPHAITWRTAFVGDLPS